MLMFSIALRRLPFLALGLALTASGETVDLATARALALASNPDLAAARARVDAAEAGIRSARRFPNPAIEVEAENVGGDLPATAQAETTVAVIQTIETGGKRRGRMGVAEASRSLREAEVVLHRRSLVSRVDKAFIALLAAQERLALARENRGIAEEIAATVQALVEAGEVSPIESTRTLMELSIAAATVRRAETAVDVAAAQLAATWAGDAAGLRAEGALATALPSPPAIDENELDAVPELVARTAAAASAAAEAELARRLAIPDLDLGVGRRRLGGTGEDTFVLSLGLTLPVWDRHADDAAAARSREEAARHERDAVHAELVAASRSAGSELLHAEAELDLIEGAVVPRAREVFAAVDEGYRLGKFSLLELLDARRALSSARSLYLDVLERRALARAEVMSLLPQVTATNGGF